MLVLWSNFFFFGGGGAYIGLAHLALYLLEGKLCQPLSQVKNILEMLSIFSCVKHCYIVLITCSLYLLFPGSFATATCMICKHKVEAEAIREEIMQQVWLLNAVSYYLCQRRLCFWSYWLVCLSVCLSVRRITYKVINGFACNFPQR